VRVFEPSRVSAVGYILVGGASSRFGRDKALVEFNGTTMIELMRTLLLGIYMPEIYLVGDPVKYSGLGIPCIADKWPGEGPLGGIVTAIQNTEARQTVRRAIVSTAKMRQLKRNYILGCDMPFLTTEWMLELLCRPMSDDTDVVVPKSDMGLEPMCACWSTKALRIIEEQFTSGVRKVTEVFKHLRTEVLDESVWKRFDKDGRLFWNMNTPADYEEARRILEAPKP
jgi:molybdenum cofactor guanylyltransferase